MRKLHKLYVKVYTRVSNEIGFWYRGSLERTVQRARLRRAIHAATKMQSVVRCRQAKKYVAWLRIAYRNAATTLQVSSGPSLASSCRWQTHTDTVPWAYTISAGGVVSWTENLCAECLCKTSATGAGSTPMRHAMRLKTPFPADGWLPPAPSRASHGIQPLTGNRCLLQVRFAAVGGCG